MSLTGAGNYTLEVCTQLHDRSVQLQCFFNRTISALGKTITYHQNKLVNPRGRSLRDNLQSFKLSTSKRVG